MAPEQAEGQVKDVGPAADVYALGAILYETLTGRPPFKGATTLDTLEQVRLAEPVPPRQLQPKVPRDLETICLKCLGKQPGQRYASAEVLADDLRRFQEGRPIVARPIGQLGRFVRWCRRSPTVAGLAAGLFVALAAGLSGVSWKWYEADGQRRRAEEAEARATARAEAEAKARAKAEQAEKDTATALNFVAASYIATIYGDLSNKFSSLLARVGKRPAALAAFQHVCKTGEKLLTTNSSGALRGALARSYAQLSVLQAAAGDREEAVRSARRGVELLDPHEVEDPAKLGSPTELGQTAFVLGALLMNLERYEEAVAPLRLAVAHHRTVLDESPQDTKRRKELSHVYYNLDHALLQAGHITESAASVRERQQLWPNDADEVYDTGCELARCAAKIAPGKRDADLTPAESAARSGYADEAIAALRKSIALGLRDANALKADGDLTILAERAEFRQLAEELAKKEAAKRH
jgi:tetratricopeptide (TPR) repeat protein